MMSADEANFVQADGTTLAVSAFRGKPLLLIFLRHSA
jgi:hypothetical protein